VARLRQSFLTAYANAITGCVSFPDDLKLANALLRACILEKTLYEIRYELANRPSWAEIPLASLVALLKNAEMPQFEVRPGISWGQQ